MYMLGSGIEGSHKLFWRNVKIECDRLCQEVKNLTSASTHGDYRLEANFELKFQQFGKWEALAASQALLIYTLVRLDEGQTEFNNHDTLLLKSVSVLWEDWLYEESKRRLCVIYRVLNMLVYYEPAAMCNPPQRHHHITSSNRKAIMGGK
ncbi:uncharacterized protein N7469_011397 [Penicillium citrinum]|uniref:Uncharacterized protein n=1 Tax=Penicillium citrinum TaxID=5077 RepID=A0A9W9TCK1_PENCI|nr:uncharacterized protein N7469_011397 [Penicillium citrinum]KAJ5217772.1 hypothetical protein N7469_011397 [Penicillium citrinum]